VPAMQVEAHDEGEEDEGMLTLSDGEGEVVNTNARKLHFGKIRSVYILSP
jgi:hypothetical protein